MVCWDFIFLWLVQYRLRAADAVVVFMVVSVLGCVAGLCNYNMVCGFGFGCWTYGLLVSLGLVAGCGDYGIVSSWL